MSNSRIYNSIKKCISNDHLKEPFRVSDVNRCCNEILKKSPSFLSKHRVGNSGGYREYFVRLEIGLYRLNLKKYED